MSTVLRLLVFVPAATLLVALSGCSVLPQAPPGPVVFDFGLPTQQASPAIPDHVPRIVQITAPAWLDGTAMVYRLAYGDSMRVATFRDSRWTAPPAALMQERLRQQIAREARPDRPLSLRIELEEFSQVFDSSTSSHALVRLRATLQEVGSGQVIRQRSFTEEAAATTADAAGGAQALVKASDTVLAQVLAWAVPAE